MSREAKILSAILVAVVGGMIALFVMANKTTPAGPAPVGDKTKIIRDTSHKTGTGSVQLVEFGDYQCPACGKAAPDLKQISKDFDGKVTFYFRNFPLPLTTHQNAQTSAEAAEAAAAQGKFWEMHDKLYASQAEWSELPAADAIDKFTGYAKDLGLDADKFKTAVTAEQFKAAIDQDSADGNALSIDSTPTLYVNGTKTTGYDYATVRDAVNAALAQK